MARKARPGAARSSVVADGRAYAQDLFDLAVRTLVGAGHSPGEIVRQFEVSMSRLGRAPRAQALPMPYVADFAHILSLWYTDPAYLDASSRPARLTVQGRGISLAALIRRVLPKAQVMEIVTLLQRSRAIVRRGNRYLPTSRTVVWPREPWNTRAHALLAAVNLLRTVEHNLACRSAADRLLQRVAANPAIPVRVVPAVQRRFNREAQDLLKRMDTYLAHHEVPQGSERTTRVGLGVFAFEDPMITGRRPGKAR